MPPGLEVTGPESCPPSAGRPEQAHGRCWDPTRQGCVGPTSLGHQSRLVSQPAVRFTEGEAEWWAFSPPRPAGPTLCHRHACLPRPPVLEAPPPWSLPPPSLLQPPPASPKPRRAVVPPQSPLGCRFSLPRVAGEAVLPEGGGWRWASQEAPEGLRAPRGGASIPGVSPGRSTELQGLGDWTRCA